MTALDEAATRLEKLRNTIVHCNVPLSRHTRFGLGGPAAIFVDTPEETSFADAIDVARTMGIKTEVIGGGTNLVCSDTGFEGLILRYTADEITFDNNRVRVQAGAVLQDLVDATISEGLAGIHTMTGVPGWVGGAVYGNAGAYGRSMHQNVTSVRFFDGERVREFNNAECGFGYRSSTFKDNKGWIVFSTELQLEEADAPALKQQADDILTIRNAKYPPTMKCAGSIFKNLILDDLAAHVREQVDPKVIREGKVPSAFFLEAVGAKGLKNGDIHVADYHANLIYNAGQGTAQQVREVIADLKSRVQSRFGFEVEEEVQYVGF
ncbi:MAG TPA: UDP-N-acetylmuramate dehydrogenase [Bryobacteraceae bacterium]|nr:UDP-N-acetylmuramate dehydrogenase [Bryobacteraceae bacterium]